MTQKEQAIHHFFPVAHRFYPTSLTVDRGYGLMVRYVVGGSYVMVRSYTRCQKVTKPLSAARFGLNLQRSFRRHCSWKHFCLRAAKIVYIPIIASSRHLLSILPVRSASPCERWAMIYSETPKITKKYAIKYNSNLKYITIIN